MFDGQLHVHLVTPLLQRDEMIRSYQWPVILRCRCCGGQVGRLNVRLCPPVFFLVQRFVAGRDTALLEHALGHVRKYATKDKECVYVELPPEEVVEWWNEAEREWSSVSSLLLLPTCPGTI